MEEISNLATDEVARHAGQTTGGLVLHPKMNKVESAPDIHAPCQLDKLAQHPKAKYSGVVQQLQK